MISNEFYKNLSDKGKNLLLNIYNKILDTQEIPSSWPLSSTTMIFKKEDPDDPNNFRPIALLSCSLKIFTNILTSRIATWAEENNKLPEEQAGFRTKRGCDEQIFN
jgi:hypothetical protein